MSVNIRVPPPHGATGCQIITPNIIISLTFAKSVMPSKRKAVAKSKQLPDPRARLSPVPSPVYCPVVSDDAQFNDTSVFIPES